MKSAVALCVLVCLSFAENDFLTVKERQVSVKAFPCVVKKVMDFMRERLQAPTEEHQYAMRTECLESSGENAIVLLRNIDQAKVNTSECVNMKNNALLESGLLNNWKVDEPCQIVNVLTDYYCNATLNCADSAGAETVYAVGYVLQQLRMNSSAPLMCAHEPEINPEAFKPGFRNISELISRSPPCSDMMAGALDFLPTAAPLACGAEDQNTETPLRRLTIGYRFGMAGVLNGAVEHGETFSQSKWQVGLWIEKQKLNEQKSCSGSLIEPDIVLTAAHCLENAKKSEWKVYMGFEGQEPLIGGTARDIPEEYKDEDVKSWDFALVFLKEPFQLGEKISTISLLAESDMTLKNSDWKQCQMSGTGNDWYENEKQCKSGGIKKYVGGILIDLGCCEAARPLFTEKDTNPYPTGTGCFRGKNAMGCSGDSGAAIVCKSPTPNSLPVIVGIHKGGAPCCDASTNEKLNSPVEKVIVRIDEARLSWIKGKIDVYRKRKPTDA